MSHLYVHVPFCARRCVYCDFAIAVRKTIPAGRYVRAVLTEYDTRRRAGALGDNPLETLYFGGGTPSLLPCDALARLSATLLGRAAATNREITLEANPDDVTAKSARAWMALGVNRVSLGVQSFDDRALRWMHRTHSVSHSVTAVRSLRDAGLQNLSLDLIFGLPPELGVDFVEELERLVDLEPEHLSVYGLTVEPRTPLARWIARGSVVQGSDACHTEQFLMAHEYLSSRGYEHYEVSNYARPGFRALHNSAYWSGRPYVGLGPSAHSFDGRRRRWNTPAWREYDDRVGNEGDAILGIETLTDEQAQLERVYLRLRTSDGLSPSEEHLVEGVVGAEAALRGWLIRDERGIRLTPKGWLELETMVVALTTSAHGG